MMNKVTAPKKEKGGQAQVEFSKIQKCKDVLMALRRRKSVRFLALWLAAYAVLLSYFLGRLKGDNYLEVFPRELYLPIVMHAVTALIIVLVLFWLPRLKSFAAKLLSVTVMALLTLGYDGGLQSVAGVIRGFIPGLSDSDPMPMVSFAYLIILFVLAIAVGVAYERLHKRAHGRLQHSNVQVGILVLVGYIFIIPAYSAARILPTMAREASVQAAELASPSGAATAGKPDIYYIVLDRYANDTTLKEQFNYSNGSFIDFLKGNGFDVNSNAYGHYPYTTMSISSTLNAQYTNQLVEPFKDNRIQSRTLYHNLIWQSSVAKALKKGGYTYHSIGSSYAASYKAPLADVDYAWDSQLTIFGYKKRLRGLEAVSFANSPYYRFAQVSGIRWWPVTIAERERVSYLREQLTTLNKLATQGVAGGRFIFAHILVPHDPYSFNADGSLSMNSANDSMGKSLKHKYVDQVEFINDQMKGIVANIQKQSEGKAVVIFNADEGPYPELMNTTFMSPTPEVEMTDGVTGNGMTQWPDDWLRMKFGILQAVHIPEATSTDLANMSSVNVFRIVLNRYLGYSLPYLPDCHFGLSLGRQHEYDYRDITRRLAGSQDDSCKQFESLGSQ